MHDNMLYLEKRLRQHIAVCNNWHRGRWVAAVDEFYIAHAKDEEILKSVIRDYGSMVSEVPIIFVPPPPKANAPVA